MTLITQLSQQFINVSMLSLETITNANYNKMKDFDTFSFSAKKRKSTPKQSPTPTPNPLHSSRSPQRPPPNWRQMTYRFERNNNEKRQPSLQNRSTTYQNFYINQKINKIDQELTQNIKRRIELQKKLYQERISVREKQNQKYFVDNMCKTEGEVERVYVDMERKTDDITNMLRRQVQPNYQSSYIENVQKSTQKNTKYLSKRSPPQKKPIIPNQLTIQKLLKQSTFPQLPSTNLTLLQKQCQPLLIQCQHSDIYYIMMVLSFHQQKYHNVRKYFRQIQMYKVFESKAYWIACQAQFQMESYQLCLKLADICMRVIGDRWMHRFLYLQAKCYEKLGNFVKSIVCYNQLIKIKPKVAELFLERAIIYDKIGYPVQAKQDYIEFSVLEPKARELLRQKILVQKNEIKRKQLIKALAKIT